MSYEGARTDMVNAALAAQATWTGSPSPLSLAFQNQTTLDVDTQTSPYLCVDLYFIDGDQLSLGKIVTVADYGQIHLVAHVPENQGTLKAGQILSHFRPYFELKTFSTIRTKATMGAAPFQKSGWYCVPLIVPFWAHRLVTT